MATAKQIAARVSFATTYAHGRSRAANQIKNAPKKFARSQAKK